MHIAAARPAVFIKPAPSAATAPRFGTNPTDFLAQTLPQLPDITGKMILEAVQTPFSTSEAAGFTCLADRMPSLRESTLAPTVLNAGLTSAVKTAMGFGLIRKLPFNDPENMRLFSLGKKSTLFVFELTDAGTALLPK
ncbi:MAG: hypothetical protein K2X01_03650 [Cyanobacteria bacterium]|nr:hypothetical protein [Cyanobacteriota bacterium]